MVIAAPGDCPHVLVTTVRGGRTFGTAYLLKTHKGQYQHDHRARMTDVAPSPLRVSFWKGGVLGLWGAREQGPATQDICYGSPWGVPGLEGAQEGEAVLSTPGKGSGR